MPVCPLTYRCRADKLKILSQCKRINLLSSGWKNTNISTKIWDSFSYLASLLWLFWSPKHVDVRSIWCQLPISLLICSLNSASCSWSSWSSWTVCLCPIGQQARSRNCLGSGLGSWKCSRFERCSGDSSQTRFCDSCWRRWKKQTQTRMLNEVDTKTIFKAECRLLNHESIDCIFLTNQWTQLAKRKFLVKQGKSKCKSNISFFTQEARSTRRLLAQKITNHCSISSSGGPERDGGGGKTHAVIRGAFCVGRSRGHSPQEGRREGRKEGDESGRRRRRRAEGDWLKKCKSRLLVSRCKSGARVDERWWQS